VERSDIAHAKRHPRHVLRSWPVSPRDLIGPLIVLVIYAPLLWPSIHVGEWFVFWYAGHVVANGGSPFDWQQWLPAAHDYGPLAHGIAVNTANGLSDVELRDGPRWLWPPIVGLALAPFGMLPLEVGIPVLHIALIAVGIVGAMWLAHLLLPPEQRGLGMALLLASAPFVQPMRAASPTILVLLGTCALLLGARRRSGGILGASALLLAVRAQVFPTVGAVVTIFLMRERSWRPLAVAIGVFVSVTLLSLVLSPIPLDPTLLGSTRAFTLTDNSSTWHLASEIAPEASTALALIAIAVGIVLAAVAVLRGPARRRDELVLSAALAVSVTLAPYVHTYDHVLLAPAWLLSLALVADAPRGTRLVIGGTLVALALGYSWVAYLVGAAGTRSAVAPAPFLALALLAASSSMAGRSTWISRH
jgi:hypothetical protein